MAKFSEGMLGPETGIIDTHTGRVQTAVNVTTLTAAESRMSAALVLGL
jgi:hypothetical protein